MKEFFFKITEFTDKSVLTNCILISESDVKSINVSHVILLNIFGLDSNEEALL